MCTNHRKLPKYTNPHVYKQQKITKIYKSTCAQTIEDYKSICASQTTKTFANPNYMHHKQKD